jgi:hypothetical protein
VGVQLFGRDPGGLACRRQGACKVRAFRLLTSHGLPRAQIVSAARGPRADEEPILAAAYRGGGARVAPSGHGQDPLRWDQAHINAVSWRKSPSPRARRRRPSTPDRGHIYSGRADRSVIADVVRAVHIP